jgi:hypothetical protein
MKTIDWNKIARGAAIAASGSLLTYAATVVVPELTASGTPGALAMAAAISVAANIVRKYLEAATNEKIK